MWQRPWSFKEGIIIGCGLLATGALLQASVGRIDWALTEWPANAALLGLFVAILVVMHLLRRKYYALAWLSCVTSAICSMAFAVLVTVVLGLVAQAPSGTPDAGFFAQLLSAWPFVLVYAWLTLSLGLTVLRVASRRWTWRTVAFMLNHLGLLIVLLTATLGNADMRRYKLTAGLESLGYLPQAYAYDETADPQPHEMDFALELKQFTIDEYPPSLMLIDTLGQALPASNPQKIVIEGDSATGQLGEWAIKVTRTLETAAKMQVLDSIDSTRFIPNYVPMQLERQTALQEGGAFAAYVEATNAAGDKREGWVSCGSFLPFSFSVLALDGNASVAMPAREPKRYTSHVAVYVHDGDSARCWGDTIIEVNRPIEINGWKVYQLSYEEQLGAGTRYSVFELVRDPWLPWVYVGIYMMLAGALTLFLTSKPKDND